MNMSYKIDTAYCWYDNASVIVKMYFINQVPFTFDELPDGHLYDQDLCKEADKNLLSNQKTYTEVLSI